MRIEDYDDENYAIIVNKRQIERLGFRVGDPIYVLGLGNGLMAILKKSAFRTYLRDMAKDAINRIASNTSYKPVDLSQFNSDELELLNTLKEIPFDQRDVDSINSRFNDKVGLIDSLLKKEALRKIERNGQEIYVISKPVYLALRSNFSQNSTNETSTSSPQLKVTSERISQPTTNTTPNTNKPSVKGLVDTLKKEGYVVLASDNEAKLISEHLKDEIKNQNIVGMKGFDHKYYIFSKKMFTSAKGKILSFLTAIGSADLKRIANGTDLPEAVCRGILNILQEEGEVMESSKGMFTLV